MAGPRCAKAQHRIPTLRCNPHTAALVTTVQVVRPEAARSGRARSDPRFRPCGMARSRIRPRRRTRRQPAVDAALPLISRSSTTRVRCDVPTNLRSRRPSRACPSPKEEQEEEEQEGVAPGEEAVRWVNPRGLTAARWTAAGEVSRRSRASLRRRRRRGPRPTRCPAGAAVSPPHLAPPSPRRLMPPPPLAVGPLTDRRF